MIKSFKSKGLKELFEKGRSAKVDSKMVARCTEVLDAINRANHTRDLNIPGYNLHPLRQFTPWKWSIWINGSWRITFEFENGDAIRVDLEQYH